MEDLRDSESNASSPSAPTAVIAGFWQRIFALLIDAFILALLGATIGTVAFRQVVELGQEGRFVGAAITLIYFGIFDSRWGGGASLGKRALGLRVVRQSGEAIGLVRSLIRTTVFWLPYYLNGLYFTSIPVPGTPVSRGIDLSLGVLGGIVVFGGGILSIYFYVFNRQTRQSLHDLVAATFVVRAQETNAPVRAQIWKGHFAVATALCLLCAAGPAALVIFLSGTSIGRSFDEMATIQAELLKLPGVDTAQVLEGSTTFATSTSSVTQTILTINVRMNAVPHSLTSEQNQVAAVVLKREPSILGEQFLAVSVTYGYDLGIFKWTNGETWSGTSLQWQQRIDARGTNVQT